MEASTLTDTSEETMPATGTSFEEFYRESRDAVARALVLTLGSRELGVEATDEAMTRAYQRWAQVGAYDNPAGWAFRVGLNWARSAWRKRRREVGEIYRDNATYDSPIDIDVERALDQLDVPFRAVVVLRFYLDWSVEETAESLGVRPGTVKSRMSRALRRLETELGDEAT